MFKTKCFPVIYLKRGVLLVIILITMIQATFSFCLVYADMSSGNDKSLDYSDESFLSEEITAISLNLFAKNPSERLKYLNEFISKYAPDILGFQEASLDFNPLFDSFDNLTEHRYNISNRNLNSDSIEINTAPILYNTDRFESPSSPSANAMRTETNIRFCRGLY